MRNDPRITAELVCEYFHYAPDTGLITYAKRRGKALLGAKAGSIKKGYLLLSINGIFVQAARVIWLHVHGKWPEHDIDHVNREKLDNRIANLRDVPPQINSWNLGSERKNNVSGHPGVHFFQRAKRYYAQISVQKKHIHLGSFLVLEDAIKAYAEAKIKFHTTT